VPRLELSGGNWAELVDISEITERRRRPMLAALARISRDGRDLLQAQSLLKLAVGRRAAAEADGDEEAVASANMTVEVLRAEMEGKDFTPGDLDVFNELNDLCIVAMVREWSFPEPVSVETVVDRKAPDFNALREACAPAVQSLYVDFSADKDPDSPTSPSSASAGHSRESRSTSGSPSIPSSEPTASSE
jgi:hypothetical protein